MYGESSFTWEYVCGYETREQKKKYQFRKMRILLIFFCMICLTVAISVRLIAAGGMGALSDIIERGQVMHSGKISQAVHSEGMSQTVYGGKMSQAVQGDEMAQAAYGGRTGQAVYGVGEQTLHAVSRQAASVVQTAVSGVNEMILPTVEAWHIPVVYLDPGHGGADEGCAREGVLEKDLNLSIALLVRKKLKERGYEVIMSRESDVYVAKEDRVKEANQTGADIYISIHQNAVEEGARVSGMEVWYEEDDSDRDSKRLAQLIRQQTIKSTGAAERELRGDADFHVTGSTSMPACLIETGFLSNAAERKKLGLYEYQEQIAEGIVRGVDYYFHPKTMYLTFDDGPSEENTQRVLDILRERNIKATFFLVGENVRRHPEMARRIVSEGHTIGIHCDNHDYTDLYESVDSYVADFEKARRTVYEVTGVETNLFRFPGGSINAYNQEVGQAIIEEMTDRGYIYYDWNASLEDAVKDPDPVKLVKNGVETTLGRKKVILLAHDVVYSTGICLEELLDSLPEYEMRPLSEAVEPIHF